MTARTSYLELSDTDIEVFEDETELFVCDTLAAVREAAKSNEDYVLPMRPLPVARPAPGVMILQKSDVMAALPTPVNPILIQPLPRPAPKVWPVYLCAFIASLFTGAAVMQSPLGPKLRQAAQEVIREVG